MWGTEFQKSVTVNSLQNAAESFQHCQPDENSENCDLARDDLTNKFMDADFYYKGYEYCINKFNKTPEECRKLVDQTQANENLNNISPSRRNKQQS